MFREILQYFPMRRKSAILYAFGVRLSGPKAFRDAHVTDKTHRSTSGRSGWPQWIGDISAAFADIGTFLPLVIGMLALGLYDAGGILTGFGVFAIATGLIYRRPVPVQPMKAIAALAITGGMTAAAVSASGVIIGATLVVLGLTGLINHLARVVPRTILFGVQVGLGLSLIATSAGMAGSEWWIAVGLLGFLAALQFTGLRTAGCLIILSGAIAWSLGYGTGGSPSAELEWFVPGLVAFGFADAWQALETGVIPQLALTVTNAVLLTAAIAADYFPQERSRISARNLSLSSGGLNLLLAPFGAMPMCHGAGGLAAQYSQGARTGLAPVTFGLTCLAIGLIAAPNALSLLALVPIAVVAAFLAFAGFQLMNVQRLTMLRPACLTIIAATALTCILVNAAAGLAVGWMAELLRSRLMQRYAILSPAGAGVSYRSTRR